MPVVLPRKITLAGEDICHCASQMIEEIAERPTAPTVGDWYRVIQRCIIPYLCRSQAEDVALAESARFESMSAFTRRQYADQIDFSYDRFLQLVRGIRHAQKRRSLRPEPSTPPPPSIRSSCSCRGWSRPPPASVFSDEEEALPTPTVPESSS